MSGEPALMSLTAVAKAIADKKVSSREVTQWPLSASILPAARSIREGK